MQIQSCGITDVGLKRQQNEDSLVCSDEIGLYVVADGMGGHAAGEVASKTAIQTMADKVSDGLSQNSRCGIDDCVDLLEAAVLAANSAIYEVASNNEDYSGMGTTLSTVLVCGDELALAHVGDSRVYRIRDEALELLTSDHSWVNEQLQRNMITQEEARNHRWRNVITRALGNRDAVEVDTDVVECQDGDLFLLCSDGLTTMIPDEHLLALIREKADDLDGLGETLIETAKKAGGDDNITLILLRVAP